MDYEVMELQPQPTAVVKGTVRVAEVPQFFGRAYGVLFETLAQQGIEPIGMPLAFYPSEPSDPVDVEAGVVVPRDVGPSDAVVPSSLPGGRMVVAIHTGPYEQLESTYRELLDDMGAAGLVMRPVGMWEEYLTDPDSEPDASRWTTRIVIPVEA